jgi:hypothetical protein
MSDEFVAACVTSVVPSWNPFSVACAVCRIS